MGTIGQHMHGGMSTTGAGVGAGHVREGGGDVVGLRRVPMMSHGQSHGQMQ